MNATTICKNCDHQFKGNFCNHCGQVAETQRLNIHHIWKDLQNGIFNFDNGIFYTARQLLTRPGHAIRDYLDGRRVRHFKPLSFVIVLATVYGLLYHFLIPGQLDVQTIHPSDQLLGVYEKVINWTVNNFAYATFIMIISTTISSYLIFRKRGYNIAEHLVLNTYYRCLVLIISILLFPMLYWFQTAGEDSLRWYVPAFQLVDFILLYWCYSQFFNRLSKMRTLGLTFLAYLFMSTLNLIVAFTAGLIANCLSPLNS
jgi:hypothetical protein